MIAYITLVLSALTLVADKPEGDLARFQGTWKVARMEINAKPQRLAFAVKVMFEGDKLFAVVGNRAPEPKGTFKIDPSQALKTYDVTTPEGLLSRGIYRLEGDTLTVCLAGHDGERPNTFTTKPDDGRTLLVYQKEKPASAP